MILILLLPFSSIFLINFCLFGHTLCLSYPICDILLCSPCRLLYHASQIFIIAHTSLPFQTQFFYSFPNNCSTEVRVPTSQQYLDKVFSNSDQFWSFFRKLLECLHDGDRNISISLLFRLYISMELHKYLYIIFKNEEMILRILRI